MPTPAKRTTSVCPAAGIFLAGHKANRQLIAVAASSSVRQVLFRVCLMHRQHKSDQAGERPVCRMGADPEALDTQEVQLHCKMSDFCSCECRKDFEANPNKHVHEMAAQDARGARNPK